MLRFRARCTSDTAGRVASGLWPGRRANAKIPDYGVSAGFAGCMQNFFLKLYTILQNDATVSAQATEQQRGPPMHCPRTLRTDLIITAALLLLLVILRANIDKCVQQVVPSLINPDFFPSVVLNCLIAINLLILVLDLRQWRRPSLAVTAGEADSDEAGDETGTGRPGIAAHLYRHSLRLCARSVLAGLCLRHAAGSCWPSP